MANIQDSLGITPQHFKDYFDIEFQTYNLTDAQIQRGFDVAISQFRTVSDDKATLKLAFLNLSAHYVYSRLQISQVGLSGSGMGITTSISTMDIAESKLIPDWVLKSPLYSQLGSSVFGLEYITYLESRREAFIVSESYNDEF